VSSVSSVVQYPMTQFELAAPGRILFGPGTVKEAGKAAAALGRRALVVTGRDMSRAEVLLWALSANKVDALPFPAAGEPSVEMVGRALEVARGAECDLVIGFGGGSAIDLAKAAAAMLANQGSLLDYLEVVGRGKSLAKPSVPWIAVPTTAGSGAEVTRNAVIASEKHRVKVSLRSPGMLARVAIVDPDLTRGLPPEVTAAGGLDALSQLVEPFVCLRANPVVDGFCREGLVRSARSLRRACLGPEESSAREDLALASLLGGLALANAGLGAVHAVAGPFGGTFGAPHGAVCGRLLPEVVEANVKALSERDPASPALPRYAEIARILTGSEKAAAADAAGWLRELVAALRVPGLASYGLKPSDFPELIKKTLAANSMKANPARLTEEELRGILERSM
jgi:alcohol dehydrogenase class IV